MSKRLAIIAALVLSYSALAASVNDVTAFGAVGDGRTDNTAALNNAFAAACSNGLPVYFPATTAGYGAKPLNTITNCSISITADEPGSAWIKVLGTGIHRTFFQFSGNKGQSLSVTNLVLDMQQYPMAGYTIIDYKTITLNSITSKNGGTPGFRAGYRTEYDGIYILRAEQATIDGITSTGNERDGIETQAVHTLTVSNSTTTGNGRFGIVAEQDVATDADGPRTVKYSNDAVGGNGSGCVDVETADSQPPVFAQMDRLTCIGGGNDSWGYGWGASIGHRAYGSVTNSTFTNFATNGIEEASTAIFVPNPAGGPITITGNTITGSGEYGILVAGNGLAVTINGNISSGNHKSGLFAYDFGANSIISNNTFSSNGEYGIYGDLLGDAPVNGNVMTANTLSPYRITRSSGPITDAPVTPPPPSAPVCKIR